MKKPARCFFFRFLIIPVFIPATLLHADSVRPLRFGPFLQQSLLLEGSPAGYRYIPPSAYYNVELGWMESVSIIPISLFSQTYFEAQANATISPFQSDAGMLFNIKPIRYLEGGLAYNRLLFPYTLVGFDLPVDSLPNPDQWQTSDIHLQRKHNAVGADVFTYQGNMTFDLGRVQLHLGASRSLWDVDVTDRNVLLEYRSGLLIQKRDRINSLYAQSSLKMDPKRAWWGFTAQEFTLRDQYLWTTHTGLEENLISAGFTGLRRGHNDFRSYHGFDGFIGYWTANPQFNGKDWWNRCQLRLQWLWNVQILYLRED